LLPHILLLLLPIGFIGWSFLKITFSVATDEKIRRNQMTGLAVGVMRLNGRDESIPGNAVLQALVVSATIWPVLFAAVVGLLAKAISLHSVQRGTTLKVDPFIPVQV
jgi:hypothetical protein